jgi:hypothetical protein
MAHNIELCAHGFINNQTWKFALIEEKGELRKELGAVREMRGKEEKWQAEEADCMRRMKMIEKKTEQREKKEGKNNVIITGIGGIRGNIERGWKNGQKGR